MHQLFRLFFGERLTTVVGMEARGFIFGSLATWDLGVGFVPLRKPDKSPYDVQIDFIPPSKCGSMGSAISCKGKPDNWKKQRRKV